jgi:single-strand DNA-binding protein
MSENSVNKVDLSGFAQNVVLRQTSTGKDVANFSLKLVHSSRQGKQHSQFVNVVAWQGHAKRVAELPKDSRVRIVGRLTTASWDDKQSGKRKYRLEVTCEELEAVVHLQQPASQKEKDERPIDDSDIPFWANCMRDELQSVLIAAQELPAPELPRLLGELEEIRATAMARLASPATVHLPDELLTVEQAAGRLGVSTDYLYRNHSRLPFVRRMGKALRFSSSGVNDYIGHKSRKVK